MNRAKDVAVDRKSAGLRCREHYPVRFPRQYWYAGVEVVYYRKAVGLRLIEIANQKANHLPFLNLHDRPGVSWSPMAYAIIET